MKRSTTPWIAASLLGLALCAGAQTGGNVGSAPAAGTAAPRSTAPALMPADRQFVEQAAHSGMMELMLGRLATMRATSPPVQAFGERMLRDHGRAHEQLKAIAAARGMTLPEKLDPAHQRDANRLSQLPISDFDRDYMKHMVEAHQKDVKAFEAAAKNAKDVELKAFAANTLPTLQQHLQLAQSTYDAVRNERGGAAATSGTAAPR
jgi:putative membrane protein